MQQAAPKFPSGPATPRRENSLNSPEPIDNSWAFARREFLALQCLDDQFTVSASLEEILDRIAQRISATVPSLDEIADAASRVLDLCQRAPIGTRPLREVVFLDTLLEYLQQRLGYSFLKACGEVNLWQEQYA